MVSAALTVRQDSNIGEYLLSPENSHVSPVIQDVDNKDVGCESKCQTNKCEPYFFHNKYALIIIQRN